MKVDRSGHYPRVSLDGKRIRLHEVIALTFLGFRPAGLMVLHGDDNPANCWLSNLSYGTPADNCADRIRYRGA